MTPEEKDAFIAKLKEERREKRLIKKREYMKKWYLKNPGKEKEYKATQRAKDPVKFRQYHTNESYKWRRGITLKEKETMVINQNGCCAICGIDKPGTKRGWALDHCHATNKIREILCNSCNSMLGYARDDVSILLRGIYYLDRHNLTSGGNHGSKN